MEIESLPVLVLILVAATTFTEAVWSEWEPYGECSRPCGGGLANKTRTCLGATHTCTGSAIRYRTCNTQSCPGSPSSLRESQCSSFDNVALQDTYYHWVPVYKAEEPCSLYCQTAETGFTLKVQAVVENGTTCGTLNGGVCIEGKCQRVGCNGVVGSPRKLDVCGVCGGDGSTCTLTKQLPPLASSLGQGRYRWQVNWGPCSATCGAGVQTSRIVCLDSRTDKVSTQCPIDSRPISATERPCRGLPHCRYRWHAFKWSKCSRSCGIGSRFRKVICLDKRHKKRRKRVPDSLCGSEPPDVREECFNGNCPEWMAGPWSKCSAPCGYGTQQRKVVCKTSGTQCDVEQKPAEEQACYSGRSCDDDTKKIFQQDDSSSQYDMFDDALLQSMLIQPIFKISPWGPCSVTCGSGYRIRKVTCMKGDREIPLSKCPGFEPHSKTECYAKRCPESSKSSEDNQYKWQQGDYGPCSSTCGGGRRITSLECVDVKNKKIVIDAWCFQLPKPHPVTDGCNTKPCPPSWQVGEYGDCSIPCGGGVQTRSLACVQRTVSGKITAVPFFKCPNPVPLSERACNLQFCQAEWRTSDWGMCSVTCGNGQETRETFCVKTVKTGVTVNVSNSECIGPRPSSSRMCHLGECYKLMDLPEIKSSPGKYIQIKRMKRVNIYVGESAILLPNQSVKIKCPVKNFHRKLIFWSKDQILIPLVGRIRVSSNGALRISRANPTVDEGTFTCTAGMLHGTVNITFQSKRAAKKEASDILNTIFRENFNKSFIDRPQADGVLKKMDTKYFSDNSLQTNHNYDYTALTTSDWSTCSVTCGKGTQSRVVTCNHVTDRFIRLLPEAACVKKGLVGPAAVQGCGHHSVCPSWKAGNWTQCSKRYCRHDGYALQKRPVFCSYPDGTRTQSEHCDSESRPKHRNLCKTRDCSAVWLPSRWSECEPACGAVGKKMRTLTCVWSATQRPAYDRCRGKPRPEVSKTCKPQQCTTGSCEDRSRYCSLAGYLRMCRYHKFRERCCQTCLNANLLT